MMHTSKAIGGPLAGVSLTAGDDWTGAVKSDTSGHYVWSQLIESWTWKRGQRKPRQTLDDFVNGDAPKRRGPRPKRKHVRDEDDE